MIKYNRILVPIDFSPASELALEWAIKLAKEADAPMIYLTHILPYTVDVNYLLGWTDDTTGLRWEQAEQDLMHWQSKVPASIPSVATLQKGNVADEVAKISWDKGIDLIVMTSRERRNSARIVRQNASEETVRLASCPVLVLHLNRKTANLASHSSR
jgi:nucleotide-binding universal stress UspA family protein